MRSSLTLCAVFSLLLTENLYAEKSKPPTPALAEVVEQLQCKSNTTTDITNTNQQIFENLISITNAVSQIAEQASTQHQTNADVKTSDKNKGGIWNWLFKDIGTTAIVSIAFNFLMWRNSCKQRKISEKALLDVQRAFVSIKIEFIPDGKEGYQVMTVFENSGSTPARDVKISYGDDKFKKELSDDFNFPYEKTNEVFEVLGPKSTTRRMYALPKRTLDEVLLRKKHIYIWAKVEYRDVFTKPRKPSHFTKFFKKIDVYECGNGRFGLITITQQRYNETDDDQK